MDFHSKYFLYLFILVKEPIAFYLKWMSTSGNEFVESKVFLVCENLFFFLNPHSQRCDIHNGVQDDSQF